MKFSINTNKSVKTFNNKFSIPQIKLAVLYFIRNEKIKTGNIRKVNISFSNHRKKRDSYRLRCHFTITFKNNRKTIKFRRMVQQLLKYYMIKYNPEYMRNQDIQVHHIDGNKYNNYLYNLRIVTQKQHSEIHKQM